MKALSRSCLALTGALVASACGGADAPSGGATPELASLLTDGGACKATVCNGHCVDVQKSHEDCGFCGDRCGAFQTCDKGVCTSTQTCPPALSGAPAGAVAAYGVEDGARAASGIPCASLVASIDTSAADHCAYYAANAASPTCDADPHVEVSGCADYVAAQFWDRMADAGYTGSPAFEDMAFVDDGASATEEWIDSVWHRVPVLSPWIRDFGYGGAAGCDTTDFGVGAATADTVTATYPYPGQKGVPTSFNGADEGPEPPVPPGGWPSGYPITAYYKSAGTPTVHRITVLGSTKDIPHQLLTPSTLPPADAGLLTDEIVLYTNKPLAAATHYHVHIEASGAGGPATFDWVFTTK